MKRDLWLVLAFVGLVVSFSRIFIDNTIYSFLFTFVVIFLFFLFVLVNQKRSPTEYTAAVFPKEFISSIENKFDVSPKYVIDKSIDSTNKIAVRGFETIVMSEQANKKIRNTGSKTFRVVIAHELAHIEENHLMEKAIMISFIIGATLGFLSINSIELFKIFTPMFVLMIIGYYFVCRKQEFTADNIAIRRLGVDSGVALYWFFDDNDVSKPKNLFNTHPTPEKRIANIKSETYKTCEKEVEEELGSILEEFSNKEI